MTRPAFFHLCFLSVVLPLAASGPAIAIDTSVFTQSARGLPGAPPAEMKQRLENGHVMVNEALATRAKRSAIYDRALKSRDALAKNVQRMKEAGASDRDLALQKTLQEALVLDENVSLRRSELAAARGDLARKGVALLRIYDAALLQKRMDLEAQKGTPGDKSRAIESYRRLAAQRDRVRETLEPLLSVETASAREGLMPSLEIRTDDDIETLLEKADLARDLEERFLRQAEAVRRRILEMEAEQSLARDVVGLLKNESLFDESDRRLVLQSRNLDSAPSAKGFWSSLGSAGAAERASSPSAESADSNVSLSGDARNESGGATAEEPANSAPGPDDNDGEADFGVSDPGTSSGSQIDNPPPSDNSSNASAASPLPLLSTEQAFASNPGSMGAHLAEMMMSGRLSLTELKRLEKKLKAQAKEMKSRNTRIQRQIQTRSQREAP